MIIVLAGLFWLINYYNLDPDFGWHYKMGELILDKGIPKTDPFSYTMPSFEFVDHEWLTNVFIFRAYEWIGRVWLALIYAVMGVLAITMNIHKSKRQWGLIPIFFSLGFLLLVVGVRPQIETWLMLAILIWILKRKERWETGKWFIPVYFILWANIHGGFAIGLVVVWLVSIIKWFIQKKVVVKDFIICVLAVFATLINPYGWKLWYEVWMQITDSGLRWTIAEWQPFILVMDLGVSFLAMMAAVFSYRYRKSFDRWKMALLIFLGIAAFSSIRHVALFVVAAIPFLSELLGEMEMEFGTNAETKRRLQVFYKILLGSAILVFGVSVWRVCVGGVGIVYPDNAVKYIREIELEGNLFSEYGWGGYLIWNFPEKKVFIDGRMPSWRWGLWPKSGEAPQGESWWALRDYLKITRDGEYEEIFDKYNIDMVLWSKIIKKDSVLSRIENWVEKLVGQGKNKETFLDKLDIKWEKIYEDESSIIYRR